MTAALREQIDRARSALVAAGLPHEDASLDAEVLARHVLGWDRAQLLSRWHVPPPADFPAAYEAVVSRRAAHEPVAFITGHREFWGLEFEVSPSVLIPRPDTELVVEQALLKCAGKKSPRIVDVGTGSGCIAVALGHELPHSLVLAIDLSAAALAVAARNLARHNVAARVQLVRGNLLDPVRGPVDLIVSNPPYVSRRDTPRLQPEVVRFEPGGALFADEDGLSVLRVLCETSASKLAPEGLLVVEFGAGQDQALLRMAEARGWTVDVSRDLAGIPRVAVMSREV